MVVDGIDGHEWDDRIGNWIQTFSGKAFWPLDPRAEEVCIEDIAHSLSLLCRFNGHCVKFYSVAEHSLLVMAGVALATNFDKMDMKRALLHDAAEAYLSDVPRPTKQLMPDYKKLEQNVDVAILTAFHIPMPLQTDIVREIDFRMLTNEQEICMVSPPAPWVLHPKGPVQRIGPLRFLSPEDAEDEFLHQYSLLWR